MSFNQAAPSFPTVINTSNCLVFSNGTSTGLTVRQFGTGALMNVATAAGTTALFVNASGQVGINIIPSYTALQVSGTILTTGLAVAQPSALPSTQAAFFGWNRAGAIVNGSTSFMNQQGGGSGGWEWINYDNSNQITANCAFLSSTGGLTLGPYSNLTVPPNGGLICPGNVGLGVRNPSAGLHYQGGASSITTNGAPGTGGMIIGSDATNGNAGDYSPVLHFRQSWWTQGQGSVSTGGISGYKTVGSGSFGGGLALLYCANGATSLSQGITLTDLGRVGINTTSPSNMLQVAGTGSTLSVGGVAGWSNVVQLGNVSYNQYGTVSAYPPNRFTVVTAGLPGANDLFNGNGGLYVASQGLRLTGQRLTWAATSYESAIEIDGGRSALASQNHGQIRFYTANSQRAVIDEAGNVGIGTTNPLYTLDVVSASTTNLFRIQSTNDPATMVISTYNDSTKDCAIRNNNGQLGFTASTTPGTPFIKFFSGASGAFTTLLAGFSSALTGGATTLSVDANGYIIRTPSDSRLKTNVEAISYGLSTVNTLRPVSYEWTEPEKYGAGRQVGMIAQEVADIVPEAISAGTDDDKTLSLDYQKLVPVLTKAIQELSAENTQLKTRLDSLEARLATLEA